MISAVQRRKPLWLGYGQAGGSTEVRFDETDGRMLVLGEHANEVASLVTYAGMEAGFRPIVLDLDGELSSRVSGYFDHYEVSQVLYDLYRMDEDERKHGQLVAAAYTAALDLTSEEEAILNAATQKLAVQDNMASPPVIYDALSGVEGFRGFYVDKLKGRVGTLRAFDGADSISVRQIIAPSSSSRGAVIDFSRSSFPHAAQLGGALFIAKLVSVLRSMQRPSEGSANQEDAARPIFLLITDVHHVFKQFPRVQHSGTLLTALLEAPLMKVFASDLGHALVSDIFQACPVKVLSAGAWNALRRAQEGQPPVLPSVFVLQDGFYGMWRPFVPRAFERRVSTEAGGAVAGVDRRGSGAEGGGRPGGAAEGELTRRLLEQVKAYEKATRPSLAAYLSAEFPREDVEREIDRLEANGEMELTPKQEQSGRAMLVLSLTPLGEALLAKLASEGDGEGEVDHK